MGLTAREVMDGRFYTLKPETPVAEAVQLFRRAGEERGQVIFGMMVTDAAGQLVGMLSMYDILLLLRPKHTHIWGEMEDVEFAGLLEAACRRAREILVGDIMTTELVTVSPDTHVLLIIDIMIKKHIRRLPVLENGKLIGIVYLSRVFAHLLDLLSA